MISSGVISEMEKRCASRIEKFRSEVDKIPEQCPFSGKRPYYDGDVSCHSCGEERWYATCEEFSKIARSVPSSAPYQMSGLEYCMGKPWCGHLNDDEEITVVDIFYVPVDKKKLDSYVIHIVDRIRNCAPERRARWSSFDKQFPLGRLRELEEIRRELHSVILQSAGFTSRETSKESMAFRFALEEYLEKECRKLGVI